MSERLATYTWSDVVTAATVGIRRVKEDDYAPLIANLAANEIWKRWDWRESIGRFCFYLVPDQQDYGAPGLVIPQDFWGLRYAEMVRITTVPPWRVPLRVIKDLQHTHVRGIPQAIGYEPVGRVLRIFPRMGLNLGSPEYLVEAKYKMKPPKLTVATLAETLLPFDDVYVKNVIEAVKWAALDLANDPRAGQVTMANGQVTYSGQLAVMLAAIDDMASSEGLELGDPVIAPANPLVGGGGGFPFQNVVLGL